MQQFRHALAVTRTTVEIPPGTYEVVLTGRLPDAAPMSFAVGLDRLDGSEAEVVVYAGGWADITTWVPGQEPVHTYHEIDDPAAFATCVDEALAALVS